MWDNWEDWGDGGDGFDLFVVVLWGREGSKVRLGGFYYL